jgi:hypothetical protein
MDTAVALVQAYLHVNGYFTVVEFPVLEAFREGPARSVTDLDILAFRFPRASTDVIQHQRREHVAEQAFAPDPVLGCPSNRPDMIVGEVKEGAARLNDAARDPAVLAVALARFGCCRAEHADEIAHRLVAQGSVKIPEGHTVRMVAFGVAPEHAVNAHATIVPMRHVVEFLRRYLRAHWDVLRHTQVKEPTFAVLALLEKWGANDVGASTASPSAETHASGSHRPTR